MRHTTILHLITVSASVLLSSLIQFPCQAANMLSSDRFVERNGYYYAASEGQSTRETLSITMSEVDPSVNVTSLECLHIINQQYGIAAADFQHLSAINDQCEAWIAANICAIVPQGTSQQDVPTVVADWEAISMTYDYAALTDDALCRYYQNALPGLTEGKGVCATYTTVFNAVLQSVPIDPVTMTVDYACADPVHYETRYVHNSKHAWSAVSFGGTGWHFYDITFYDQDNGRVWLDYLDMDDAAIHDGHHDGYYAFQ